MNFSQRIIVAQIIIHVMLSSCISESHNAKDIQFIVRNSTSEVILWDSYNSGENRAVLAQISTNDTYITGGGGILIVDSVVFIRQLTSDSIIFRNERFGDDLSTENHFFNRNNWKEERFKKFYYT